MAARVGGWPGSVERVLNQNADELEAVELSVGDLQLRVQQQDKEILRLRAMTTAMAHLLVDKGVIPEHDLRQSIDEAFEEILRPPPAPSTTGPYRGGNPAPAAPPRKPAPGNDEPLRCTRCGMEVPMKQTNFSAAGDLVCDVCLATSG